MIDCPLLLCIVPMYVFVFWAGGLYYVINYLLTYLLGIISFLTVNVTVLQCNWLQNTENNLLIQLIYSGTGLFQYSYV